MKNLFCISILFFSLLSLNAQENKETAITNADTIVQLGGRKLIVYIMSVTSSRISYKKPNDQELLTIDRDNVERIIYHDGRKETFNKPLVILVDEGDWKTVIVTDEFSDVSSYYSVGEVKANSAGRDKNIAKKNATIKLQKKAVNLGAAYIYVTNRELKGGFGEVKKTYFIEGVAYSFKPKEE